MLDRSQDGNGSEEMMRFTSHRDHAGQAVGGADSGWLNGVFLVSAIAQFHSGIPLEIRKVRKAYS
jgi:hypothetical protein